MQVGRWVATVTREHVVVGCHKLTVAQWRDQEELISQRQGAPPQEISLMHALLSLAEDLQACPTYGKDEP
jgi:hypothetical protein